jgi:hypothetical protein
MALFRFVCLLSLPSQDRSPTGQFDAVSNYRKLTNTGEQMAHGPGFEFIAKVEDTPEGREKFEEAMRRGSEEMEKFKRDFPRPPQGSRPTVYL